MAERNTDGIELGSRILGDSFEYQRYVRWIGVYVLIEAVLLGTAFLINMIGTGQDGGDQVLVVVAVLLAASGLIFGVIVGAFILLVFLYDVLG